MSATLQQCNPYADDDEVVAQLVDVLSDDANGAQPDMYNDLTSFTNDVLNHLFVQRHHQAALRVPRHSMRAGRRLGMVGVAAELAAARVEQPPQQGGGRRE